MFLLNVTNDLASSVLNPPPAARQRTTIRKAEELTIILSI
jgi:hypothetical protein